MKFSYGLVLLFLAAKAFAAQPDYEPLVKATLNKVVMIEVRGMGTRMGLMDLLLGTTGQYGSMGVSGSGSLLTGDGVILTCDHLFTHKLDNRKITVKDAKGHTYKAILLDEDKGKDLATLKIFPLHTLPHFGLGKALHQGQHVLSFGAPLGIENSVSFGYVTNLSVKDEVRYRIMHSASINPGNSGGPLVDEDGKLVGVNIESFVSTEGMHLAVTLKDIRSFLGE